MLPLLLQLLPLLLQLLLLAGCCLPQPGFLGLQLLLALLEAALLVGLALVQLAGRAAAAPAPTPARRPGTVRAGPGRRPALPPAAAGPAAVPETAAPARPAGRGGPGRPPPAWVVRAWACSSSCWRASFSCCSRSCISCSASTSCCTSDSLASRSASSCSRCWLASSRSDDRFLLLGQLVPAQGQLLVLGLELLLALLELARQVRFQLVELGQPAADRLLGLLQAAKRSLQLALAARPARPPAAPRPAACSSARSPGRPARTGPRGRPPAGGRSECASDPSGCAGRRFPSAAWRWSAAASAPSAGRCGPGPACIARAASRSAVSLPRFCRASLLSARIFIWRLSSCSRRASASSIWPLRASSSSRCCLMSANCCSV